MIDWTRIDELIAEIGAEDFGEVVTLFLEEVDEAMATLEHVDGRSGSDGTLHLIKGCSWNLGFESLGSRCADFERGDIQLDTEMARDLRSIYAASRSALQEGLAKRDINAPAA
ncbi:MAG: Hpt domain-containing protein [Pseudomonadota bacterium]